MMPGTRDISRCQAGSGREQGLYPPARPEIGHCDRLAHSVIVDAAGPEGSPRKMMSRQAYPALVKRITRLNVRAAEFLAECVD